ncbi:MAG TPA: glycosyltransferase family 2 protein [Candidatus Paceibacterota bacterium]|nr:glycosyltransferase family 2 protein [Candidatus Paceibacterota bacterium]
MYRGRTISFYFPCRNEASHLKDEVARLPAFVDEIIIVSNRSTDGTVAVAQTLPVRVIEDNREKGGIGYGYAHMTGLANATGDIIATADADGTYPVDQLAEMIDALIDGDVDFLSCNRYPLMDPKSTTPLLKLGVWILNTEVAVLYGLPIKDILSGMWLVTRKAATSLALTEGDWNLSPQIKLNAARNPAITFREHHITLGPRRGETKQHYFKTGFSHLVWILRNRFS